MIASCICLGHRGRTEIWPARTMVGDSPILAKSRKREWCGARLKMILPPVELCYSSEMQLRLFSGPLRRELSRGEHGGDRARGRRKGERPVSTRRPIHLTLHSRRATGVWSLRRHERAVREALRACARRADVRIYDFANVGSHLHLLVRVRRRQALQAFLRSFAGIVARKVTGAKRGRPLRDGSFWSALAWSRVVAWGRDYWGVRHYIFLNRIEGTDGPAIRRALEHGPAP
jgi:REP element-mobilizing transposase RayT